MGVVRHELSEWEDAAASYMRAIALNPDKAEVHSNLGVTLKQQGKIKEAEECFVRAIAIKPNYAEAHMNLGVSLKEQGRLEESEKSHKNAIMLKPKFAEAHLNLGNTLRESGRLKAAEAMYKQATELNPDYAEAFSNLGSTLKEQGKFQEAEESYRQAIAVKPDYMSAQFMLAALSGETIATSPRDYVESLFDYYADKFDRSLVDELAYQMPKLAAEVITKDRKTGQLGAVLDLGCGTGLFGVEIRAYCDRLEGIDLSANMLHEAKKKQVYDKLIKGDIATFLSKSELNFDYFVATDVFIYVGDLSDIFRLIKHHNNRGGKLVFSTEDCTGKNFFLEKTGRYSHSKGYIEGLCEQHGYELKHYAVNILRKERNSYISGGLYVLEF